MEVVSKVGTGTGVSGLFLSLLQRASRKDLRRDWSSLVRLMLGGRVLR